MWGNGGDFGGGGGGGGGGFMQSPGPGATDEKAQRVRRSNNYFPCTIKQLLDCPEETLKIEDIEAHIVTIVGIVRKVETSTTKYTLTIDDNTGSIPAISYVGGDGDASNNMPILLVEGSYGRIVGQLRSQKNSKYIVIFKVFPITDLNEVTCHHLEVLQIPQKLKKLKAQEASRTGFGAGGGMGLSNTFNNTSMMGGFGGNIGGPPVSTGAAAAGVIPGLTAGQNKILNYLKKCTSEDGVHRSEMARFTGMPEREVNQIIDFLSGEGHIYTTVDDDHFKVTDW